MPFDNINGDYYKRSFPKTKIKTSNNSTFVLYDIPIFISNFTKRKNIIETPNNAGDGTIYEENGYSPAQWAMVFHIVGKTERDKIERENDILNLYYGYSGKIEIIHPTLKSYNVNSFIITEISDIQDLFSYRKITIQCKEFKEYDVDINKDSNDSVLIQKVYEDLYG